MPETTYSTTTRIPIGEIWDFVQDMDHWAPFFTGYQSHSKVSDTLSEWTLRGEAGALARSVTFKVRVTEWNGPERVAFDLEGVNEDMRGGGFFELSESAGRDDAGSQGSGGPELERKPSWWARLRRAVARLVYRWMSRSERPAASAPVPGGTRITFQLSIEPGGPMAPMINSMIGPFMEPAAEDLIRKILDHLDSPASTVETKTG